MHQMTLASDAVCIKSVEVRSNGAENAQLPPIHLATPYCLFPSIVLYTNQNGYVSVALLEIAVLQLYSTMGHTMFVVRDASNNNTTS